MKKLNLIIINSLFTYGSVTNIIIFKFATY